MSAVQLCRSGAGCAACVYSDPARFAAGGRRRRYRDQPCTITDRGCTDPIKYERFWTQPTDGSSAMTDRPNVSMIGKSIVIKGELSADEDVVIEGQVEGNISLNQNVLTVGGTREGQGKDRGEDGSRCREGMGQHHSCRERRYPRHEFGGRRHLHVAAGDGRWGLCPRSHRHTAVAKRKSRRGVHRRQGCARTGQVPREVRCEAGDRPGDRRSRPEVVAAPSKRSWRSRWSASCCSR